MAGMTLEWQVFLRGIDKRIEDIEEEISSFSEVTWGTMDHFRLINLGAQLSAFQEVRDYIKGEMK